MKLSPRSPMTFLFVLWIIYTEIPSDQGREHSWIHAVLVHLNNALVSTALFYTNAFATWTIWLFLFQDL